MKKTYLSILAGMLCGGATFASIFFLIPAIASGLPDFLWIGITAVLSCVLGALILEKIFSAPVYSVLVSLLCQILLVFILAEPASGSVGINLDSGFGLFEFIGFSVPWIFGTTFAQFAVLLIIRKLKKGKELSNG